MKRSIHPYLTAILVLAGACGGAYAQGAGGTGASPQAPGAPPETTGRPAEEGPTPGSAAETAPERPAAFQFNGYFRSTLGNTDTGDAAKPFILPGAPVKYRLGNEPEHYGEFTFSTNHPLRNGPTLGAVAMIALNGKVNRIPFLADIDHRDNRKFAQLYIQAADIPGMKGARVWAGRIFYRRVDIHISDFYYWNPSGDGGGIENIPVGDQKLSYALFRRDGPDAPHKANRHDLQISGIRTNRDGELQMGLSYIQKDRGDDEHSGWSVTAQHKQDRTLGGSNRFALQYGVGPGSGYAGLAAQTGDVTQGSGSRSYRIIDALDWQTRGNVNGQVALIYQRNRNTSDGVQEWISGGVRPVYAFTDHFKLAVELGHDRIKPYSGDTRTLTKITVAPILSVGRGFYDRPELRLFYTYARWNRAAQNAAGSGSALSATGPYGGDTNGSTYGIQLESWW